MIQSNKNNSRGGLVHKRQHRLFYLIVLLSLALLSFENTCLKLLSLSNNAAPTVGEQSVSKKHTRETSNHQLAACQRQNPLHVLFGLSGSHPGFFAELQVALKSVLLNAPLDRNLSIHFMADQQAHEALGNLFHETNLTSWQSRSPVSIWTYNIQPYVPQWEQEVRHLCHATGRRKAAGAALTLHTMGTWFRLFAYQILPTEEIESVLYMDTDVVVTANLEALANQMDPQYAFQWGDLRCAGFMILTLSKLKDIWNLALTMDFSSAKFAIKKNSNKMEAVSDQLVFQAVEDEYRHLAGRLTSEWDISLASGAWRFQHEIPQAYPALGMMHYNGGAWSKDAYWNNSVLYFNDEKFKGSLGITNYYIHLPWTWARSYAKSLTTDQQRFNLQLFHRVNGSSFYKGTMKQGLR